MKTEKFLLWTVTFALVVAGFSGIGLAQEQSRPQKIVVEPKLPFKVNVWVDKGCGSTYRVGESLTIYFESSRDCYLTLFDFAPEGKVRQIFPNRYRGDNFIRAHRVYAIPRERFFRVQSYSSSRRGNHQGSGYCETMVVHPRNLGLPGAFS